MIPQDTTEVIWAFSGTVVGLIVSVAASAIVRQVRHNSTGSTQADRWEDALDAAQGFVLGDAVRSAKFSKLLQREDTRGIVIEAFSNVARANPENAKALRHHKEDAAVLREWVANTLEDKDAGRRAHACEVVATLRLRACHGMVLAATGDEDANVRVSATRSLCVLDPETAVGVLLGLIEKEGSWAADLLADLLQRMPVRALGAVMQRAREWGATPALVKLLTSCPSELANPVLLSALETENPELRARVAEAIWASTPEAVSALATLLSDPHEGTRLSAVRSLGRVHNPKALITLSSSLSDSSRLVRFAAAEGIGGTPGGSELLARIVSGSDLNAAEAAELTLWRLKSEPLNSVASEATPSTSSANLMHYGSSESRSPVFAQSVGLAGPVGLAGSPPSAGSSVGLAGSARVAGLAGSAPLASRLEVVVEPTFENALATLLDESKLSSRLVVQGGLEKPQCEALGQSERIIEHPSITRSGECGVQGEPLGRDTSLQPVDWIINPLVEARAEGSSLQSSNQGWENEPAW
jgi:HEAT repeats